MVNQDRQTSPLPRRRRILFGILLSALALLFSFTAGEILVRLTVPENVLYPIGNYYAPHPDPEIGYTLKHNFHGTAFGVDLKTNSLGFRGPEWKQEKEADTLRILLIGDSHTFGYGVPFEDTFGEVIRRRLQEHYPGKKVEVLNSGVAGYNSLQEFALLKKFLPAFRPDLVVIQSSSNDFEPIKYSDEWGGLHGDGYTIPDNSLQYLVDLKYKLLKRSRLVQYLLLRLAQARMMSPLNRASVQDDGTPNRHEEPKRRRRAEIEKGLNPAVSLLKEKEIPAILTGFGFQAWQRRMFHAQSRKHEIPIVIGKELFPEAPRWKDFVEQFGLPWDGHMSARGHRRLGEGLAEKIIAVFAPARKAVPPAV